jgi:predicted DNA-binding protein (MmcQ/YjbR family)
MSRSVTPVRSAGGWPAYRAHADRTPDYQLVLRSPRIQRDARYMRHATHEDLDHLEALLAELRQLPQLRERRRGYFSRGGRAFLHFHADVGDYYADVKLDSQFHRVKVTSRADQAHFLTRVKEALRLDPVEVPEDIVERIRALCLALPEVTVRVDGSLSTARSTAQSFDIRRRSFCLLVAREGSTGKPVPLLVLRADPEELEALLSVGHPFFASRASRDRIVVVLTDDTDWEEIRELVTESYRILAPKKLTALLD